MAAKTICINIGGRAFDLAPYRLGAMRQAAPFLDRINALSESVDSLEGATAIARDILEVLAIGIQKIDPLLSADALEDMVGMDDMPALRAQFSALLLACGLAPKGEAPASAPQASELAPEA